MYLTEAAGGTQGDRTATAATTSTATASPAAAEGEQLSHRRLSRTGQQQRRSPCSPATASVAGGGRRHGCRPQRGSWQWGQRRWRLWTADAAGSGLPAQPRAGGLPRTPATRLQGGRHSILSGKKMNGKCRAGLATIF